jgi:hypothetical protein
MKVIPAIPMIFRGRTGLTALVGANAPAAPVTPAAKK